MMESLPEPAETVNILGYSTAIQNNAGVYTMRIVVLVDMEGITGICKRKQTLSGENLYPEWQELLVGDATPAAHLQSRRASHDLFCGRYT